MAIAARSRRDENANMAEDDRHLATAARLLGLDPAMLRKWLTHRSIQTGREVFTKPMTVEEAQRARDALAKHIYARIFGWVVDHINASLAPNATRRKSKGFIGVLDIYGFETFQTNR
jgi:myosin-5